MFPQRCSSSAFGTLALALSRASQRVFQELALFCQGAAQQGLAQLALDFAGGEGFEQEPRSARLPRLFQALRLRDPLMITIGRSGRSSCTSRRRSKPLSWRRRMSKNPTSQSCVSSSRRASATVEQVVGACPISSTIWANTPSTLASSSTIRIEALVNWLSSEHFCQCRHAPPPRFSHPR